MKSPPFLSKSTGPNTQHKHVDVWLDVVWLCNGTLWSSLSGPDVIKNSSNRTSLTVDLKADAWTKLLSAYDKLSAPQAMRAGIEAAMARP